MSNDKQFIKELIKVFGDKTGCYIQHNKCPCNRCFHNIEADFRHICWLIILRLRGDYLGNLNREEIINMIKEELKENEE